MMIVSALGAGLITASVFGFIRNTNAAVLRKQTKIYFDQTKGDALKDVHINHVKVKSKQLMEMQVTLPYGMEVPKFRTYLEGLEMATHSAIILKHLYGRVCSLSFGYAPFYEMMNYRDDLHSDSLAIPLFTPFGTLWLDFGDETNCHLVLGGATRMGKTVLIRLIVAHLMRARKGRLRVLLIDNKVTDVNMFQEIPQIQIAETLGEAKLYLEDMMELIAKRKELLKSKKNVVDVKELRVKYPDINVDPIFIVIDEYGRFSEDKDFQEMVTEIAETAGYLDVHLIIAAQRPDASKVLNPRIKANIVTRLAFSTANETNSNIILDLPDAAHLGMIQGRAYLLDSTLKKIQIPYLSSEQTRLMMKPYYRKEWGILNDGERQEDSEISETVSSIEPGTLGAIDLPGSSPTKRNRKPDRKKVST